MRVLVPLLRVLLGRVYTLRRVEEASVRVVTPLRVPDERVPTTRLVVVPLCPLLL